MEGRFEQLAGDVEWILDKVRDSEFTPEVARAETTKALGRFSPGAAADDAETFIEGYLYDTLANAVYEWAKNY